MGIATAVMWGGLAAMLIFIPYVGPMIMSALLLFAGLTTFDNLATAFAPSLLYLGVHALESNFVTPTILGRQLTINPAAILLSISYWGWIWGVVGVWLSMPLLIISGG